MKIRILQPGSFFYRFLLWCACTFMDLWMKTLRVTYRDATGISKGTHEGTAIIVFWHNRILAVPFLFPRVSCEKVVGMASRSKDGQLISDLLAFKKMRSVRGSANKKGRDKGGAAAIIQSLRVLRGDDCLLCLVPDGPRGPVYTIQPGAVILAAKSEKSIIPMTVNFKRYIKLPTWDALMIPWPFSKAEVIFGEALSFPKETVRDQALLEAGKEELRLALNKLCE
jgi:lysophospholipid acyltransferase (LPLAT)-like uncharacterized protein